MNRTGWRTSELTFGTLMAATIYLLAQGDVTLPQAILRGCACLALAWIAGKYAHSRAEAKRGHAPSRF